MKALKAARDEAGQALIVVAITLTALLMTVGLAVDAGELFIAHRTMQEAADAAAYAGAVVLYQGGTEEQAQVAAVADATRNGFTHDVNGATVTVARPSAAPYNSAKYVEVTISTAVRTTLLPQQAGFTTVTVNAVAGAEALNSGYAIIALDKSCANPPAPLTYAFNNSSQGEIHLIGGGILINNCATPAAANNITNAGNFTITGGGGITVAGTTTGTWPVTPSTGQPAQGNPFAGTPMPSTTGLLVDPAGIGPGGNTLISGVYTTTISGKNLCGGVYILKGGGMGGDMDVDTSTVDLTHAKTCDGKVFIFNTMTNYPSSGGTCAAFGVSGNHPITLNPMDNVLTAWPGGANYIGMLFYQDPACSEDVIFGGSFEMISSGTIYVPNAAFRLNGNAATINGGQIVAKWVDTQNATLNITFNSGTSAQPILPRLVR